MEDVNQAKEADVVWTIKEGRFLFLVLLRERETTTSTFLLLFAGLFVSPRSCCSVFPKGSRNVMESWRFGVGFSRFPAYDRLDFQCFSQGPQVLYGYFVGSLDVNFLGKQWIVHLTPTQSCTFCRDHWRPRGVRDILVSINRLTTSPLGTDENGSSVVHLLPMKDGLFARSEVHGTSTHYA